MTPLRQRMIEDMKLRNYAPLTIKVYIERVDTFAKHFGKSPERLRATEVRAYLLFLVQEKRASWSYYGQAVTEQIVGAICERLERATSGVCLLVYF